jgi:predicted metal-dependent peptidase
MKTENVNLLIEQAIFELLGKLPYYGCLIQGLKLVISRDVPTAGVRFDGNGTSVRLTVNPDYFAGLTLKQRCALLIHEASHIDRLHLIRIPQATANFRLGNIAADAAINCYIPDLPEGGIYPKNFKLKNFQSFEWYLERLTDNESEATKPQRSKGNGSGQGEPTDGDGSGQGEGETPDDANGAGSGQGEPTKGDFIPKRFVPADMQPIDTHDWDNSGLSLSEQAEVIENIMERAIEKMGLDAGSLPAHVQESLKLLRELKVKRWHKELKRFLGRTVNGYGLERTWSRRNRRYGLNEAGSKVSGQKKLVIAFDTSGSVSERELKQYLAETMAMVKTGVIGHLVQFDEKVNGDIVKLKRSELQDIEIVGRGGTSFKDLMNKVDAFRADAVIVFTDGADNDTCERPKTPVLWAITGGGSVKYDWGFRTIIDYDNQGE